MTVGAGFQDRGSDLGGSSKNCKNPRQQWKVGVVSLHTTIRKNPLLNWASRSAPRNLTLFLVKKLTGLPKSYVKP